MEYKPNTSFLSLFYSELCPQVQFQIHNCKTNQATKLRDFLLTLNEGCWKTAAVMLAQKEMKVT